MICRSCAKIGKNYLVLTSCIEIGHGLGNMLLVGRIGLIAVSEAEIGRRYFHKMFT